MPSFKTEKSEKADRGKATEREVHHFLESVSRSDHDFDFLRLPDAKAAMGRMKAMPADFEFFAPGIHGLLEAKETEHTHRLTRAKVSQLPMMRKRFLAGGRCFVVVFHSTTKKWRKIPIQLLDPGATSWDLSGFTEYDTVAEALHGFAD